VLEEGWVGEVNEDDAIDLAIRGLKSAMKRDAGSGEGIHVVVITKDKYEELNEDKLKKYLAKTPL
jgi:proteasome beta subunit